MNDRARTAPPTSIVWFRQDLRVADNPSLITAAKSGAVLPVYILDEDGAGEWAMGGAHRWWLHHSLAALSHSLAKLGAPLVLRRGKAAEVLAALVQQTGAAAIHAGWLTEPWARARDEAIAKTLPLQRHRAGTLYELGSVKTKTGTNYGIYTPFAKAARALPSPPKPVAAPKHLDGVPGIPSEALESWALLPTKPDWAGGLRKTWTPGEAAAHARMTQFLSRHLAGYDTGRNIPGADLTSMLSPHLHWGELSPAQVWHAASAHEPGAGRDTFLGELLWHEFSANVLWHHPKTPNLPQRAEFGRLPWRQDRAGLRAWQRGQTGVPIVDAGMRQLWRTGWMHNRVRMITASFLIKHLLIDWVEGERWFWDTLVDGDLAVNAQSWQWVAGCGIDNQPFFRVFNPVSQGEKFDASGAYVRHWVPEVANLPDKFVHAPWTAPAEVLRGAGVHLGKTYPHPIVPLTEGRERALAAFKTMRDAA